MYDAPLSPNDEELLRLLEDRARGGDFAGLDELLLSVDTEATPTDALVICLCATFGARERLTNWPAFVERTRLALAQRGLAAAEIDSILAGLE